MKTLLAIGILLCTGLHASAALDPGKTHRHSWPKTEKGYIRISVPAAAAEGKPLPVLFWFHGTGGSPSIFLGHEHRYGAIKTTGRYALDESYAEKMRYIRDHLIVVGMSYPKREPGAERYPIERIWETCRAVRDWLHPQVAIDQSRCYMGGFSRGGNNAFRSAIHPPPDLAGVAMFAGGVPSGYKFDPNERYKRPFHVLLGLGEMDSNFWSGHIALRFFKSHGSTVTYDEWLNGGHSSIEISRRMLDWFEMRLREKEPGYAQEVTRSLLAEYQETQTSLKGWERFVAFREMLGDPRLAIADPRMRAQIQSGMNVLSKDLPVAKRYRVFQKWNRLVRQEVDLFHHGNVTEQALLHLHHQYQTFPDQDLLGLMTRNSLMGQLRTAHYMEIGMYNTSEQSKRYDAEPVPEQKNVRDQLTERLARLEQELEEAEGKGVRAPSFNRSNERITQHIPSLGNRNASNTLKLQIQQVRTQLASLPADRPAGVQRKVPPPPRTYQPLTDFDRQDLQDHMSKQLKARPIDRFSLRSGPAL